MMINLLLKHDSVKLYNITEANLFLSGRTMISKALLLRIYAEKLVTICHSVREVHWRDRKKLNIIHV